MNKEEIPLKTTVVGLGSIGQELDAEKSHEVVLSHSRAFHLNSHFHLSAGVDRSLDRQKSFQERFDRPAYPNFESSLSAVEPDVVVIAVPTSEHLKVFKEVIHFCTPALILCEKPVGAHFREAEEMLELAAKKNIPVVVNFMRRFDPGVHRLRTLISSGGLGHLEKIVVWYSKGLRNSASHFLDLLQFLIGAADDPALLTGSSHSYNGDPEPDFMVRLGPRKVPAFFLSAREENFSIREIQMLFQHGGVFYKQGGLQIEIAKTEDSKVFQGYSFLSESRKSIPSDLPRIQSYVVEGIYQFLRRKQSIHSRLEDVLPTLNIVEKVQRLWELQKN